MSWAEQWIVVTDLDGTLLDHHTYSWQPAEGALRLLAEHHVPVVLCSSKTLAEMRILAEEMGLNYPLIVENGAAVAWPEGDDFRVEPLGRSRQEVIDEAHRLRRDGGYQFSGFADWSVADVVERSALAQESAALSLQRHGTEPIIWDGDEASYEKFVDALALKRIRAVRGGRFIHLMGFFDKADGMKMVCEHFAKLRNCSMKALAFGDSPNDAQMLNAADVAVRIRSAQSNEMNLQSTRLIEPQEPGPTGWAVALSEWWRAKGEIPIKE